MGEVELFDGAQEWKLRGADPAREARTATVRDLLGEERLQELVMRPLLFLGALNEITPNMPSVGEVQTLQQHVEVNGHDTPRFDSARSRGSTN